MIETSTNIETKKAFIFDMDGTIVDNISFHNRARLLFLERYGVKLQPNELNNIHNLTTKELIKRFISTNLTHQEIKELDNEKQVIYRNLYKNHIQEVPGLKKLLNEAKNKGMLIALATMGCRENIDLIINTLGVKHHFDSIVSGDDVKKGKPHPDIYKLNLALLNINPEEAIVFEDTYNGVVAAQQAKISVVGVTTSHSKEEMNSWGVMDCVNNFDGYLHRFLAPKGMQLTSY
jgi:HAD superfamily hydrolase (TIGR01509 family)